MVQTFQQNEEGDEETCQEKAVHSGKYLSGEGEQKSETNLRISDLYWVWLSNILQSSVKKNANYPVLFRETT